MTHTTSRPDCRRRMPAIAIGLMVTMGGVPVVLTRLRDPQVVRSAVQTAIQAAEHRCGTAARQEARMLTGLLGQI